MIANLIPHFLIKTVAAATLSLTGLAFSNGVVIQLGGVFWDEGSDTRTLGGTAVVGINNNNVVFSSWGNFVLSDGIIVGYLEFDQGLPGNNCYGSGDCWPARWNQKPGGSNGEGYLSGWAKLEIGSNSPEMWVHFKTPANPNNYACVQSSINKDQNYYVCSANTGQLYGYAWSSGADFATTADNPGLGWLDFSQASVNYTAPPGNPPALPAQPPAQTNNNSNGGVGVINASAKNCFIAFEAGSGNKTICAAQGTSTFKCLPYGSLDPQTYEWKCEGNGPAVTSASPTQECNYQTAGEKTPALTVIDKSGEKVVCQPLSKVTLTTDSSCRIKVRKAGVPDSADKITLISGDTLEAELSGQCIGDSKTVWDAAKLGNILSQNNSTLKVLLNSPGQFKLNAQVTLTDGRTVQCQGATVTVKEKIKMGQ